MGYYNYNYQQGTQSNFQREYAIDWEAKSIPLLAYKNCLVSKESMVLSVRGLPEYPKHITKARFMASIVTFFDTVESGFAAYLKSEEYQAKPDTFDKNPISVSDYEQLMIVDINAINERKLYLLFRIIKNWCFERGPFQTFSEQEKDVFERLEEEDA